MQNFGAFRLEMDNGKIVSIVADFVRQRETMQAMSRVTEEK